MVPVLTDFLHNLRTIQCSCRGSEAVYMPVMWSFLASRIQLPQSENQITNPPRNAARRHKPSQ